MSLWVLMSLSCFVSVFIPPTFFWPAVFSSYAIPVVGILNVLLLLFLAFFRWRLIIFPLSVLLAGLPFVSVTYRYNKSQSTKPGISVLSYNTRLFRMPHSYGEFSTELISMAANDPSDIKCFQEYSTNVRWQPLDVTGKLAANGYFNTVFTAALDPNVHNAGLAIFSKFPILDTGLVWDSPGRVNACIYADILIHNDTLRIYNVHLESMALQLYQYKSPDYYGWKLKELIRRLRNGARKRSEQVDQLIAHTSKCPYPFIICGDFNETPYSYNYFRLKWEFDNSFEEAGSGFGFTLNSMLFFIRIDHHFHSDTVDPKSFSVDRTNKMSDHFPTRATYTLH